MKLVIIAVASLVLTAAVIFYSDHARSPVEPPPVTNPIKVAITSIFDPNDVTQTIWKYKNEILKLKKGSVQSPSVQWALQRRLVALSKFSSVAISTIKRPLGEVIISTATQEFRGDYDEKSFRWSSGPLSGQGILFQSNANLKELLYEGLWGFKNHDITFCDPKKLTKVTLPDWTLEKNNGEWTLHRKNKIDPVRRDAASDFFDKLCHDHVDAFDVISSPLNAIDAVQMQSAKKILILKKSGPFYLGDGYPNFRSESLELLLTTKAADDLRDPSADEVKVATDHTQSQEERIKSIRKLRGNNSPEALNALRNIVFENTDIDLYRYEAVDTLAATGTKEAYKIIRERLAQVGRSGFELRLARALSGAMGRFFKSDEKTPEDIRRPEVDEVLKAAEEHPPGKALANPKTQ